MKSINIDIQIFTQLCVIAQAMDIDIQAFLKHELAPVPLTLFNFDGSFRKTQKSTILSWLEKDTSMHELPKSTLAVVDMMVVLRMV